MVDEGFDPFGTQQSKEERSDALAAMSDQELLAAIPADYVVEEEEPPEPEGHPLSPAVADWLKDSRSFFPGPLPHDIGACWSHPPHRVEDEATCRILVATWGLDGFRGSALHRAAVQDKLRAASSAQVTALFKAEREGKAKRR